MVCNHRMCRCINPHRETMDADGAVTRSLADGRASSGFADVVPEFFSEKSKFLAYDPQAFKTLLLQMLRQEVWHLQRRWGHKSVRPPPLPAAPGDLPHSAFQENDSFEDQQLLATRGNATVNRGTQKVALGGLCVLVARMFFSSSLLGRPPSLFFSHAHPPSALSFLPIPSPFRTSLQPVMSTRFSLTCLNCHMTSLQHTLSVVSPGPSFLGRYEVLCLVTCLYLVSANHACPVPAPRIKSHSCGPSCVSRPMSLSLGLCLSFLESSVIFPGPPHFPIPFGHPSQCGLDLFLMYPPPAIPIPGTA